MTYPSSLAKPYVYQCVHKVTGEFYIGFRERNVKLNRFSHNDLPIYRTSSKYVKSSFEEFDWIILAEFAEADDAYYFEQSLIYENWKNPLLLNRNCQFNGKARIKGNNGIKGKKLGPYSEERRAKNSASQIGRKQGPHSAEHREKIGAAQRGIPRKPHTEEWKIAHSAALIGLKKGIPQPTVECPHCKKIGSVQNMARWHFDNCKAKNVL